MYIHFAPVTTHFLNKYARNWDNHVMREHKDPTKQFIRQRKSSKNGNQLVSVSRSSVGAMLVVKTRSPSRAKLTLIVYTALEMAKNSEGKDIVYLLPTVNKLPPKEKDVTGTAFFIFHHHAGTDNGLGLVK